MATAAEETLEEEMTAEADATAAEMEVETAAATMVEEVTKAMELKEMGEKSNRATCEVE